MQRITYAPLKLPTEQVLSSIRARSEASLLGAHLVLQGGWLHHLQGSAVHLQQAIPPLAVGNCCGGFL